MAKAKGNLYHTQTITSYRHYKSSALTETNNTQSDLPHNNNNSNGNTTISNLTEEERRKLEEEGQLVPGRKNGWTDELLNSRPQRSNSTPEIVLANIV